MLETFGVIGLIFSALGTVLFIEKFLELRSGLDRMDKEIKKRVHAMVDVFMEQIVREKFDPEVVNERIQLNKEFVGSIIKDIIDGKTDDEYIDKQYNEYLDKYKQIYDGSPRVKGTDVDVNKVLFKSIIKNVSNISFSVFLKLSKPLAQRLLEHRLTVGICLLIVGLTLQVIEKLFA